MGNSQSRSSTTYEVPSSPGLSTDSNLSQLFARDRNEGERTIESLETRRRLKEEKETRRAEKEKASREQAREASMKHEHVDGGYLVTQGVYVGNEDFNHSVVRQAIIERKLAPFWRGLDNYSSTLTEHQLVALARGQPLPAADAIPEQEPEETKPEKDISEQALKNLTVPISSRVESAESSRSWTDIRTRNRTGSGDVTPDFQSREIMLPKQPEVNGQPLEAYLYKNAEECPICFLAYPPYLNSTRCCFQPICSECFCQIARKAPHAPEGEHPRPGTQEDPEKPLISEPASCPYCAMPEFGITYTPPPFSPRGLSYSSKPGSIAVPTQDQAGRRRAASLAASHPSVITTDRIRPNWAADLLQANMTRSRRHAAATALHTAAYIMNAPEPRMFGRRHMLRRPDRSSPGSSSAQLGMFGMMADRYNPADDLDDEEPFPTISSISGPPRFSSRRNNRMEDLEEMMMMEAIRLSLAAEQERQQREQKQEQKDKKKADKQKVKDDKKAEKAAKKGGLYLAQTDSSTQIDESDDKGKEPARPIGIPGQNDSLESPQSYLERSRAQILVDSPSSPSFPQAFRPSHLRSVSGVSSSASSFVETGRRHAGSISSLEASPNTSGIHLPDEIAGTPPGGGAGLEPMFNFRSLAAMMDEEDKKAASPLVEHCEHTGGVLPDPLHDGLALSSSLGRDIATSKGNPGQQHPLSQTTSTEGLSSSSQELKISEVEESTPATMVETIAH